MPDLGSLGDGLSLGGYAVLLFCFYIFYLSLSRYVVFIALCLWKGEEGRRSLSKNMKGRERGRFVEVAERIESRVLPAPV
jgi:hypothetical protein